jgi:hypothetical protein
LEDDFIFKMGGTIIADKKNKKVKGIRDTKIPSIIITKELLENGKSIKEIAKERNMVEGTIIQHIEDLIEKFPKINIDHIKPKEKDISLVRKINNKLKGEEKGKLSPIKTILESEGHDMTWQEIRIAKLFI